MTSIWDAPEMKQGDEDQSNSKFLNKALGNGDSLELEFVNVQHEDQREETPEIYKTDDGKEWVFYFVDREGKERTMTQRSTRGALFGAMRAADIQPETWINLKRVGAGIETEYEISLLAEQSTEVKKEEKPF